MLAAIGSLLKGGYYEAVRRVLVSLMFLLVSAGLYGGMVGLEYYWNVPDWQPRPDLLAVPIFAWLILMLLGAWFLAGMVGDRIIKMVCLLPAVALVALAVYVAGPEPLKPGFLGRESASPRWYRAGRLVVLCLPAAFCLARLRRR